MLGACRATYLRKMLKKVLNLELSSGGFSVDAPGVEARDAAFEAVAEFVVEPGRALSAARSAMLAGPFAYGLGVSTRVCTDLRQAGMENRQSDIVAVWRCVCPAGDLCLAYA